MNGFLVNFVFYYAESLSDTTLQIDPPLLFHELCDRSARDYTNSDALDAIIRSIQPPPPPPAALVPGPYNLVSATSGWNDTHEIRG